MSRDWPKESKKPRRNFCGAFIIGNDLGTWENAGKTNGLDGDEEWQALGSIELSYNFPG